MATGVLGLGNGASALNSELIDKLKESERVAKISPLETSIENWDKEKEAIAGVQTKVDALMAAIKPLDLFATGASNAFNQIAANSSGDSVLFDAEDLNALKVGTTTVNIESLAKQDIYQTSTFSDIGGDIPQAGGSFTGILTIKINTTDSDGNNSLSSFEFNTDGKTYDELVKEINSNENFEAAVEHVGVNINGDDEFRIIIKSKELGLNKSLTIIDDTNILKLDDSANHVQDASNMKALINNIKYDLPTNDIKLSNGLKITAMKVDTVDTSSSISISKDNSGIEKILTDFASAYNDLVIVVEVELYSGETVIEDKAALRSMMEGIKSFLFKSYGKDQDENDDYINDKSIFNYGFQLGKDGSLNVDSEILNKAISDDYEGLQDLFIGTAATQARGLGTQLKEHIDFAINSSAGGILSTYESHMDTRKTALEEDKAKAIESLDNKYEQMSLEFAAYNGVINSFSSSFSALQLMIQQSVSTG